MILTQPGHARPSAFRAPIPILGRPPESADAAIDRRLSRLVERLRRALLVPPADAERLHALFLDDGRSLLGEACLANGTASALSLRLRDLFGHALGLGASQIILAHNHPSGDCRPSDRDLEATRCVASVAHALDIRLLDHLIFTHSTVFSMRAGGEL